MSASAVGFYGTSETASFNEDSPAGTDVLGKLCSQWEAAAQEVNPSTRLVITRIGIVPVSYTHLTLPTTPYV